MVCPVVYLCNSGWKLWMGLLDLSLWVCAFCLLRLDKELSGRGGLLQISWRTFLMSHQGTNQVTLSLTLTRGQRTGPVCLAVSGQITGRFQIIVRPVLALVIRHAVLSEARAAGEVKRQWHEVLLLTRWGLASSLRIQTDQLWYHLCSGDAQRSLYSSLQIRYYLSCECETLAVQLEFDHLLSQNSLQVQGVLCSEGPTSQYKLLDCICILWDVFGLLNSVIAVYSSAAPQRWLILG